MGSERFDAGGENDASLVWRSEKKGDQGMAQHVVAKDIRREDLTEDRFIL